MKKLFRHLKQNKGVSLVEVLVSLAVSFIVFFVVSMFMTNGTSFFNRQSRTISLQNELMEVSNKINDAVIQSTALKIKYNTSGDPSSGFDIYTGGVSADEKSFTTGKGNTPKKIEWGGSDDGSLYVLDSLTLSTKDEKAGYLMGNRVTDISISFTEDCATRLNDGSYLYEQPLIIKIEITVSDGDEVRSDSRVVTLRNEIDSLIVDGNEYVKDPDSGVLRKK